MKKILTLLFILNINIIFAEDFKLLKKLWDSDNPEYIKHLDHGINYNPKFGSTALHKAAFEGKINIVKALLKKGARVNLKDYIYETPLHKACSIMTTDKVLIKLYYNIAELLINNGADVNATGGIKATGATFFSKGEKLKVTPLHIACTRNYFDLVILLIKNGANVNARDWENNTPLHLAVQHSSPELVEYLISKGAKINEQANYYDNPYPIHEAARRENKIIIELLFKSGAKMDVKNIKDETPYQYCLNNNRKKTAEFIKQFINKK